MNKVTSKTDVLDPNEIMTPDQDGEDDLQDALLQSALSTTDLTTDDDDPTDPVKARKSIKKSMRRGLLDWRVSKKDADNAFEELSALDDATQAEVCAELHADGKLQKLLAKIPASTYADATKHGEIMRLYGHVPPSVLKAHVQDLLTLGVFDRAVKSGEVDQILDIMSILPDDAKEWLATAENGRFLDTLLEANAAENRVADAEAARAKKKEEEAKRKEEEAKSDNVDNPEGSVDPATSITAVNDASLITEEKENKQDKPKLLKRIGNGIKTAGNVTKGIAVGGFIATRAALTKGNVDLDHVEAMMGGDVGGLEIDGKTGKNQLDIDASFKKGLFKIDMPQLAIESVSRDGVSAGASSISNFVGTLKWRTKRDNDAYVDLKLGNITLGDTTLDLGGSSYNIKGLRIDGVHLHGTDSTISSAKPMKGGEAIKLAINYAADMLGMNLPAIKGVLSANYDQPETIADRLTKQFGLDSDIDFDVKQIKLDEVKKDGEVMAADVDVQGLGVTVEDVSMQDRLTAERERLATKIAADTQAKREPDEADTTRLAELDNLLNQWDSLEARLVALQAKSDAGELSRGEQNELIELRNQIRVSALTLDIASVNTGKFDYDGNGVDGLDAKVIHAQVSGGFVEEARRAETDMDRLEALLATSDPDSEGPVSDAPAMIATGSVASWDLDGGSYTHETYGRTDLSTDGTTLGFSYNGETGDAGATADTFNIDGLDFGAGAAGEYAAFATTMEHAQGKNLDFSMNMNSGAMKGGADELSGKTLAVPGYQAEVDAFSAETAKFSYGADGAIHAEGKGATVEGVDYAAPGNETELKKGSADSFTFDMYDQTLEDGTKRSVMKGGGTGLKGSGIEYSPKSVEVGTAEAASGSFSMTTDLADGMITSTTTVNGTGVNATDIDYLDKGAETHVKSFSSDTTNVLMKDIATKDCETSTIDVNGTGLAIGGVAYDPMGIGVDGATADTYRFNMNSETDKDGTTTTMGGGGTGIHADGFSYGKDVSVRSADMSSMSFDMRADGSVSADATDIKARGVDAYGAKVGYVGGSKGHVDYSDAGVGGSLDGYDVRDVGYGAGDSRVELDAAGGSTVDFGYSEATGTTVTTPDAAFKGLRYGDTDNGKGTTIDYGSGTGINANIGENTVVKANSFDAGRIHNLDYNVAVQDTHAEGVHATVGGDGSLVAGARSATTGQITYGDAKKDNVAATVASTDGTGLSFSTDADGLMGFGATTLNTGAITNKYGSRNTSVGSFSGKGLNGTDLTVGGDGVFGGTVTAKSMTAKDVDSTDGLMSSGVTSVTATDVYAMGNNTGALNTGAKTIDATGVRHTQDADTWVTADTMKATGIDAALSNLNGTPSLDGLAVETFDGTNIKGTIDPWKHLNKPAAPGTTTTSPPGGEFKADALAKASGTLKATVPISVDLGWAGSIDIDVRATIPVKNGEVNLADVDVDFVSMNAWGWIANRIAVDSVNPGLTIDGSGNLEVYFEIPIPLCPDIPVWVNIFDGSDAGMSGGWIAPNVINLEGLVEGLLKPKTGRSVMVMPEADPASDDPTLVQRDNTYVAPQPVMAPPTVTPIVPTTTPSTTPSGPTTTASVDSGLSKISPYVNTKRASIDISALKLGDGVIGNDNGQAELYGSANGANQIDGHFEAGKGGNISSDLLQAREIKVGSDISVGDAKIRDLDVNADPMVNGQNKLDRSQQVHTNVGSAEVTDIKVGDQDVLGRDRFKDKKKK